MRRALIALAACSAPAVRPPSGPPARDVVEQRVATSHVTYVLRASRQVNLLYQLDCLAWVTTCSHDALESLWARELPHVDGDKEAIQRWHALRMRYTGQIAVSDDDGDADPLPLARDMRSISQRIRIAAYDARDRDDLWSRLGVFLDPADLATAREVVARFEPRFDTFWQAHRAELARDVEAFAGLTARAELVALEGKIARFYAPALPGSAVQTIDLVAVPRGGASSNAEQLRDHAVVEVVAGDRPTSTYPDMAHEMFHAWHAAAELAAQRELAERFVAARDPIAIPSYGLLDEVLATAFGNGMVERLLDPDDFAKRARAAQGFYADAFIDPVAKQLLPVLDAQLAAGKTLFDAEFVPAYLAAVHAAFPAGLPPIAYLRPMAAVFDAAMHHRSPSR